MGQHERVCETLCNRAGFTKCWDGDGLTAKYERIRASGKMSSSEALLLDVALDVWNGHGNAPLGRVINVLDNGNLAMVARLLSAIADGGVDGTEVGLWLKLYEKASKPFLRRDEIERANVGMQERGEPNPDLCGCGHSRSLHELRNGELRKDLPTYGACIRSECACKAFAAEGAAHA